ncbi:MAG: hypothetical protein NTU73_01330 [Ignavibacteriae bacterium]|nr:hypothetical protein [Ignavibacteriota bacterium]
MKINISNHFTINIDPNNIDYGMDEIKKKIKDSLSTLRGPRVLASRAN